MTNTNPARPRPSRRQSRYGRLVRGWSWRTTQKRLDIAEQRRAELGITRTEFLERAIDHYAARRQKG